jgi:hypothetical protein
MKYAIISNESGEVENIILWNGDENTWHVPEGKTAVPIEELESPEE